MSSLWAAKRKLLEEDEFVGSKKTVVPHDKSKHKSKKEKKKKRKKEKKAKKKHKKSSSSSSSDSDDSGEDEWVEKQKEQPSVPVQRDDWMTMTGAFKTFSREDMKVDVVKSNKGQLDSYDPSQCSRELNPYWKDNGTGLPSAKPSFKKPSHGDNVYSSRERHDTHNTERRHDTYHTERRHNTYHTEKRQNWKKDYEKHDNRSNSDKECNKEESVASVSSARIHTEETLTNDYMTDDEMNKLGAKIVKAEILGNTGLVKDLNEKLQKARDFRKANPDYKPTIKDNAVMLTLTNSQGNTRPLMKSNAGDSRSRGGKKKMETHTADGDRVRFYADDDKYSLNQMFEREKYGNTDDSKEEFLKAISKHKNLNDDMDDIFSEKITKNISDAKMDEKNMHKAISQHQKIQKSLDDCNYCVESGRINKKTIVHLGSRCFISLPDRTSLVKNHCIISTVSHVSCSTMVDEDVWAEIMEFRKALVNMFNSRKEDVVFFETAVNLHKYPHMIIHCVPLPRDVGDMASIYFKKAILECEIEWSNNKKVIDLKGKDVRRGVPKGLPYFWVDFGTDPGFAHVIEDQQLFPRNFAEEIIGGMLDLDHKVWRKPQKESFETVCKKVAEFTKTWKPYEPVHK